MPRLPLEPGASFGPHYVVDEKIGEGGMGVVYRGRDLRLGRSVALKVLSDASIGSPDSLRRFEQEARTASSLNHPNIVTIHEVGQVGDVHFIAQEFVVGQTLRRWLAHGRLSVDDGIEVAIQVASALDAAHAASVIHRDIKPENIMLRPDGYAKVLDFGLAKLAQSGGGFSDPDAATAHSLHTRTGAVMGTVKYMSPEQARGLTVDARSDVFSLGVVLYEMIAGRAPFDGRTSSDMLVAILSHDAPTLGVAAPGTPAELERIVSKALRKKPEERYQGVKDLLVDMKALKAASQSGAQPPPPARRSVSMKMAVASVGLVGVLVFTAVGVRNGFFTRSQALTSKDTILLADFTNTTGEPAFDGGTLKQALIVQLQQTPFLNPLR